MKLFTILREPVSHIRSSYNYLKWNRKVGGYSDYLKRWEQFSDMSRRNMHTVVEVIELIIPKAPGETIQGGDLEGGR